MTSALCFSPLKLRQIPVRVCVSCLLFAVWLCVCCFVPESITPQARGYVFLYPAVTPHTFSTCGQSVMFYQGAVFSTRRQCGGNIVVLLGGIFSLAYTGLSGLYYP